MTEEEYEDLEYGSGYLDDERDIRTQPLFTLTAEEVEIAKPIIEYGITLVKADYTYRVYHRYDWQERLDFLNHLLTRIKQWQDENNRTTYSNEN